MKLALPLLAALALATASPVLAAPALSWTTLGTNSGPIPNPERSQAANLLRFGDQVVLVDIGDGAPEQLAKAGVRVGQVQTVVISHLHFDHTGGLFALLGMRVQTGVTTPLAIYGPPGTRKTVETLFAAMGPGIEVSGTIRGPMTDADKAVTVIELADGQGFNIGPIAVKAVTNSHYVTLKPNTAGHTALSFRFEAGGRSVLYTGDTGPSDKVETLCKGADLLVSEIMDPVEAITRIRKTRPEVPEFAWKIVEEHFRLEHLSPEEAGLLADRCGAKALVLTHNSIERPHLPGARATIAARYKGPITFAEDLQVF